MDWSSIDIPVSKALLVVLLAVLVRYMTSRSSKEDFSFPPWAALEIAFTGYMSNKGGFFWWLYSTIRRHGGALFGITSKHQVLVDLPGLDRFMSQSHQILNSERFQISIFTRVFGATDSPELQVKFQDSWKELTTPVERLFLNDAATVAVIERGSVAQNAASFVSFASTAEQMKRWELSADISVIEPDSPRSPGAVEANLQSLSRDFGASFAIPLLYGQDFLDRNPNLLSDFWKFDNDVFPLLMIGIPQWAPFKIMREGVAARSNVTKQLEALYRRIDQYQRGDPIDFDADMSDISTIALERSRIYNKNNWPMQSRGEGDFSLLWGQNANTQPVLFWLLVYVYSTPDVLARVRSEIEPHIKLSPTPTHLAQILSVDLPALSRECPFLKACIFETYRMANEATSIRYVARPLTITDGSLKHELQPGTFISAPHSIHQRDPGVYADPDNFIPDRFLSTDEKSGRQIARYGALRPWGSGAAMCKGRTFAEKEIAVLGASIFSLWDIGPAGGEWKLPAMVPGTGVKKPVQDIHVVIKRRVFS